MKAAQTTAVHIDFFEKQFTLTTQAEMKKFPRLNCSAFHALSSDNYASGHIGATALCNIH